MNHTDTPLAPWERELLRDSYVSVAVFVGGNSHVFYNVDKDSLRYYRKNGIGILRFRTGVRDTVVPGVDYWTEEA